MWFFIWNRKTKIYQMLIKDNVFTYSFRTNKSYQKYEQYWIGDKDKRLIWVDCEDPIENMRSEKMGLFQ